MVPEAAVAVGVAGAEGGIANDRTRIRATARTSGFSLTIRKRVRLKPDVLTGVFWIIVFLIVSLRHQRPRRTDE